MARYFDLTAAERPLAPARPARRGPPVRRPSHVAFEAKVSKREYEWLTTRPADLLGQSHSRYDAPDSTRGVRRGCGLWLRWSSCSSCSFVTGIVRRSSLATGRRWPHPTIPDAPPAVADIPPDYLALYQDAAARFGLDWPVLAAVGKVETNHGRNRNGCAPNFAGARGPMQFLEPTFVHAAKLAGLSDPDICDPADAIPAAAAYLKSNGAPADWQRALFRYNPADWYPPLVMGWAERYGYGARVVWPVEGGRISQGFGPTSFSCEPAGCFEGKCYPHFHDGIDIAALARHAGPGDRRRPGDDRRAIVRRCGRRRDRAQPWRPLPVRPSRDRLRRPGRGVGRRRASSSDPSG